MHKSNKTRHDVNGSALLPVIIFIALILAFGIGAMNYLLVGRRAGKTLQETQTASQIAEAGIQKTLFCLNATVGTNCGGTYGINYVGETNAAFGGGKYTTALTGTGVTRTVTSTGTTAGGRISTIKTDMTTIPPTDSTSFTFALQSGQGGAFLSNNSSISGTIYSNGDVVCNSTNAFITGDAYSSKSGGKIDKCWVKFHAHADKVLNGKVSGDAYYKNDPADISGTTVTGTKYSGQTTPAPTNLPSFNENFWKESAEHGGIINGNYTASGTLTLGPVKINGNLTVANNAIINIHGPIWVKGNITTGNNVTFQLESAFGQYGTVILTDDLDNPTTGGRINISNNTSIYGSGNPTSHILFVSTNTSVDDGNPALTVSNNSSGAVFLTMNGTMKLSQNAGAKSLAGYRLYLDELATVSYVQSEFTGYFSNSPGGSFRLLEGTWREIR